MKDLIPMTANNSFFIPGKNVYFWCGGVNMTLLEFQLLGFDIGSQVYDELGIETILKSGKEMLSLD